MAIWIRKKNEKEQAAEEKKTASKEVKEPAKAATKAKASASKASAPATKATTSTKVAPAKPAPGTKIVAEPKEKEPAKKATKAPAKGMAPTKSAPKAEDKSAKTAKTGVKAATAAKKEAPAKPSIKPLSRTAVAGRPFYATTEEDLRVAFDTAIQEADTAIIKNGAKAVGKYEFSLEEDGYHFYLLANNGQVLFESPGYTTLLGALNGISVFQKTVAGGDFDIKGDKYKRFRFILANKYYGENYSSKEQCQKCADSVRNFAGNSRIIRFQPTKEELKAYEIAKITTKKSPDDVDWNAIARLEATTPKKGKFEICEENKEYCFYLLANNGQILYSSRYYANEAACRKGIDSFKRAVYVGNFFVDSDKFGRFRYVLKNIGSAPAFIGESYDNRPQCEKIIESVKNFVVSASIVKENEENA